MLKIAPLNSPSSKSPIWTRDRVSSPSRSHFSPGLKLILRTQVTNPEIATFQSLSKGVYDTNRYPQQSISIVCLQYLYCLISFLLDPCWIKRSRALWCKASLNRLAVWTKMQKYATTRMEKNRILMIKAYCINPMKILITLNMAVAVKNIRELNKLYECLIFFIRRIR